MMDCPLEDRLGIADFLTEFCHAVDCMADGDAVGAMFTPDAVLDFTGIGFPRCDGRAAISAFYAGTFAAAGAMVHHVGNVAVTGHDGATTPATASVRAYVNGIAQYKDGSAMTLHGRYYFDLERSGCGWLARHFTMDFLIPPG